MPRILIVDDDNAYRSVIKEHLLSTYEVIDTGSAENALVMAVEQAPDAILLDLSMPGISGFELCQTLSSLSFTQKIPIFIISGQDERNKTFCQSLGASRYFPKPIDLAQLKADLKLVLSSQTVERRRDIRIQLKLPLLLRGQDRDGTEFEINAETENLSRSGFLCASRVSLEETTTVEVFLSGEHGRKLGEARLVRVVNTDALNLRYGFQFTGS
jgi:DNA-binding response OmpR family regulator